MKCDILTQFEKVSHSFMPVGQIKDMIDQGGSRLEIGVCVCVCVCVRACM